MSVPYAGGYLGLGNSFTSQNRGVLPVGGWVELGRTTLGSGSDTISVGSLSDKRYYMVLANTLDSGGSANAVNWRLNADGGLIYARRFSNNGATDSTAINQTVIGVGGFAGTDPDFAVGYFANVSSKEKLNITYYVTQNTAGAGTAPQRVEIVGKSSNTAAVISTIASINGGTGDYATGSEVVVLGWDPADVHTTNFWEELASVNASGSDIFIDSGTITAKKYLFVWVFIEGSASSQQDALMTFNGDTSTNYADRVSSNGAADNTSVNRSNIEFMHDRGTAYTGGRMAYGYIINNSANEKLIQGNYYRGVSGAATAPQRSEYVGKWDNVASQITSIRVTAFGTPANYPAGSIMKVWGSD
jgi:hypothetical protein